MDEVTIYKYQPDAMKREDLEKIFVGEKRKKLLEKLYKEIAKAAEAHRPKYYLIVGPRGIGKTHFATLLYYRLRSEAKGTFPVKLSEEEFSVYRVSDLLQRVLEIVKHDKTISRDFEKMSNDDVVVASLEELRKLKKIVILFIENLNQIIGKQMDETEVKRLRSLLQKEGRFIIVATTPLMFPEISSHEEPFFNFFEVFYLLELTRDELKELLRRLAKLENNKSFLDEIGKFEHRIDAIATLTGGNPRIAILLYDLTKTGKMLNVEKAFFKILDDNTPYYQDVFRMLSGEQRKIFDELIALGEPATPKVLASRSRLSQSVVNSQMRRLEKDGFVISHKIGRETKYEVRERLFRLWRELRKEPLGKERLSILIKFLEVWYSAQEREEMLAKCLKSLENLREEHVLREAGYWFLSLPDQHRTKFLPTFVRKSYELGKEQMLDTIAQDEKMKKKIAATKIIFMVEKDAYEDALKVINEELVSLQNHSAFWLLKSVVLFELDRLEDALNAVTRATELDENNVLAWSEKGRILATLGRYEEGLQTIAKAIELDPNNVIAWGLKGETLLEVGRDEEALQASTRAVDLDPKMAIAWDLQSRVLERLDRGEESLEASTKAIELDPSNARFWNSKGNALFNLGREKTAMEAFSKAIELDPKNVAAWIGKGLTLKAAKNENEAKEAFLQSISVIDQIIEVNPHNYEAWLGRVIALINLNKYRDAANASLRAAELISDASSRQFLKNSAVHLFLVESFTELERQNTGNSVENLKNAIELIRNTELTKQQMKTTIEELTTFLTNVISLKNVEALRIIINEISDSLEFSKDFLKPFKVALEIVETGDVNKYYDVQMEVREVVAAIVAKLTGSDKLAPPKDTKPSQSRQ
jgi:hypothetical protein